MSGRSISTFSKGRGWSTAVAFAAALCLLAVACRGTQNPTADAARLQIEIDEGDADADLFVDGNYVGQVKEVQSQVTGPLLLAPGVHRVEVRKPGRFPVQRTVRVGKTEAGKAVVVAAELLTNPE